MSRACTGSSGGPRWTAIAVAGAAGLVLAPVSLAGAIGTAGFGTLALTWLACAALGLRAILRGDITAHRRWMLRTFALTYAGVTLRLSLIVLIPLLDDDFLRAYLFTPFLLGPTCASVLRTAAAAHTHGDLSGPAGLLADLRHRHGGDRFCDDDGLSADDAELGGRFPPDTDARWMAP